MMHKFLGLGNNNDLTSGFRHRAHRFCAHLVAIRKTGFGRPAVCPNKEIFHRELRCGKAHKRPHRHLRIGLHRTA